MEIFLNNFGSSLHVENRQFLIIHSEGKQYIDPQKVKNIYISKGAKITSDAVMLAIEHEIDVLFLDNTGTPKGRIWSVNYGSISTIRQKQADFIYSQKAISWIKEILIEKIKNQTALLYSLVSKQDIDKNFWQNNPNFLQTITALKDYIQKIEQIEGETISDIAPSIRGWEGIASKRYFETLSQLLPEPYRFEQRSQHPAFDMFNCLLNYGYGILYGKIESALIKAGIDPYLGVFHRENYNRPVLVFDIIELFRQWIDYIVCDLCLQEAPTEDWFSIQDNGSYWLEAAGKRILIQSINDYLNEIITINNLERSRLTHINIYAQQLAQYFLNL
ncbi:MAG: CRISPR-associated endonuclease Cas1 [Bacteroidales bacterium]|nr:CRISPR-associated endonuclease Cas1 [Bacteroidales bacterium]